MVFLVISYTGPVRCIVDVVFQSPQPSPARPQPQPFWSWNSGESPKTVTNQSTPSSQQFWTKENTYNNLPKITLVTRSSSSNQKLISQFYCMYLRSVVLFWPGSYGGMVIALDRESKEDQTWGITLKKQMNSHFPNMPFSVYYEPLPNDKSILKSTFRPEGYVRQLWSTYFADLYTDSEIIAYMDGDVQLVTPMTEVSVLQTMKYC